MSIELLRLPRIEESTGAIGLQIRFLWSIEFLSKQERASTFLIFPRFAKYRAIFSLLTVEVSRAISSSRVTGLFTVRGIH